MHCNKDEQAENRRRHAHPVEQLLIVGLILLEQFDRVSVAQKLYDAFCVGLQRRQPRENLCGSITIS